MDEYNYMEYINELAFEEMIDESTERRIDSNATLKSVHPQQGILLTSTLDDIPYGLGNNRETSNSGYKTLLPLPATSHEPFSYLLPIYGSNCLEVKNPKMSAKMLAVQACLNVGDAVRIDKGETQISERVLTLVCVRPTKPLWPLSIVYHTWLWRSMWR